MLPGRGRIHFPDFSLYFFIIFEIDAPREGTDTAYLTHCQTAMLFEIDAPREGTDTRYNSFILLLRSKFEIDAPREGTDTKPQSTDYD